MKLHWVDIITLVMYLSAVLGIGIYFSKKTKPTEDYFVEEGLTKVGLSV